MLAGVALLLAELFLLPGFGIAGFSGFACLVAAVVLAYIKISLLAGYITLGACVVLSGLAIWGFVRSKAIDKMALETKIESHVELADNKLKDKEEKEAKTEPKEKKGRKRTNNK